MRRFGTALAIIMAILAAGAIPAAGQESGGAIIENSLYSDVKARNVGDILSVIISENNSATNATRTTSTKQDKASAKGEATTGALAGLFPGVGGSLDIQNQYSGQGGTVRNGQFSSRMSVKVTDVMPNGNLIIEGTKTMEINSETEVVTLSGTVKPEDVSSSNTVYSYQVANTKITYKGKGSSEKGHRPGLLTRFLIWVF